MSTVSERPKVTMRTARKQGVEELLNSAFALTHRMHALDKTKVGKPRKDPARVEIDAEVADLRAQRDIIVREIKRRAGE